MTAEYPDINILQENVIVTQVAVSEHVVRGVLASAKLRKFKID